jgi:hypothetical protein
MLGDFERFGRGCAAATASRIPPTSIVILNEPMLPAQVQAIHAMSLERRLALGLGLIRSSRRLQRAALRGQHSEWTDADVASEIRRLTTHGRT